MTSLKDPLTLGAVLYEGFELLDLYGPLEMFGNLKPRVEIVTVAEKAGPVSSFQGPQTVADFDYQTNCLGWQPVHISHRLDWFIYPKTGFNNKTSAVKQSTTALWRTRTSDPRPHEKVPSAPGVSVIHILLRTVYRNLFEA